MCNIARQNTKYIVAALCSSVYTASACILPSLAMIVLFFAAIPAIGQANTASLSGAVTDSAGAIVPDASVEVKQVSTGSTRTTQTNASGLFTIPLLQPGTYTLKISKSGFSVAERSGIELQISQAANVTISLSVGSVAQTVEVTGGAPLLETQTVQLGTVVGAKQIVDLPLNGRQFTQLLQLAPGTVPIDVSQNSGADTRIGQGGVLPSINGGSNRSNLFFVNGVVDSAPFENGYTLSPSVDAIQEFQEQTHAGQAEVGQAIGGTVNIATRAGTNSFHGTAFEFLRNDALDANNLFNDINGVPRGAYKQNQFGGTLGAPIVRNKLFAFGYYEGYRQVQAASVISTLPTQAELGGDFSALLPATVIYDPATYNPTTHAISAFAGNIIPKSRLNAGVLAVLNDFLPSSLPTAVTPNNYVNTQSLTINQNSWGIRVDYMIARNDLLYAHYFQSNLTESSPDSLPSNPYPGQSDNKNTGVNWIHTFSPTLTSQITVGLNWTNNPGGAVQPNAAGLFDTAGFGAGFTPNPGAIPVATVPAISPSGYFGIASGYGGGAQAVPQVSGSISKERGAHTLRVGASYYKLLVGNYYAANSENFNQQATWNPCATVAPACVGAGGDSFASLLLGLPVTASRQLGNSGVHLRSAIVGVYAEDTWKLSKRLTASYGIRWDYTSPTTDTQNRLSGFDYRTGEFYVPKGDVDAPSVLPAGVFVLPSNSVTSPDYKNVSPRLGLAFLADPKTTIRSGFGIIFDNWSGSMQAAQNARGAWPSGSSQTTSNTNVSGITPGVTVQNPFGSMQPTVPASPYPSSGWFPDRQLKNAYSMQWNLEIQHELASNQVFSIAYVGSATDRSPLLIPGNQSLVLGPAQVLPYPNMQQFSTVESHGRRTYNGLQSKYEWRYSKGLALTGSLTWSKTMDVGCVDYWEGCNIQNGNDLSAERAVSSLDVPVVFTLSAVYELPFGKGKSFATGRTASILAGGWHLNGLVAARGGTPFTATINFDNANANGGTQRPNLVGDPENAPHTIQQYFNTAAYAVAAPYTYGNVSRNSLRGPGYTDVDFSFFRDFKLFKEGTNLQFRAEAFNMLNHPNLSNPNSVLGNSNFGTITSIFGNQRQIQVALKVTF